MAAIASVAVWRPRTGSAAGLHGGGGAGEEDPRAAGWESAVWSSQFGGEPQSVGYVIETAGLEGLRRFGSKLAADPEWLALVAEWASAREPAADLLRNQVSVELPVA